MRNRCTECGTTHPKWAGRCPSCGAWNTLVEEAAPGRSGRAAVAATARPITEIVAADARPVSTGLPELDRVLGGGLVPGSVTVVGGEPGIGKSTLLLQVAAARARAGAARALRLGGGERRTGAGPGRSAGGHGAGAVAAVGDAGRRGRVGHRRAVARARRGRLHPDPGRPGRGLLAGVGHPGAGHGAPAGAGGQAARRGGGPHRPRHEGRRAGRPAGAGTRRGHRALLRGGPPPRPPAPARRQAPLRTDERARPVRDGRVRPGRGGRRQPPVPVRPGDGHPRLRRRADVGRSPAAPGRGAGARRPQPAADAPPLGPGLRPGPAGAPGRRAQQPRRPALRRPGRLRLRRRRGPAGRAGQRPRDLPGAGIGADVRRRPGGPDRVWRGGSGRRAAAGRADRRAGWPRRRGWASAGPSCRRRRQTRRATSSWCG